MHSVNCIESREVQGCVVGRGIEKTSGWWRIGIVYYISGTLGQVVRDYNKIFNEIMRIIFVSFKL